MPSMKISLVLFVLLISVFSFTSLANLTFWGQVCDSRQGGGTEAFIGFRNSLLSYFANNSVYSDGFYTRTEGQSPNTVHGYFLCRGDLVLDNCHECIKLAADDLRRRCPLDIGGIIWYSECLVHYSTFPILTGMMTVGYYSGPWVNDILMVEESDSDRFNQVLETLMENITTQASLNGSLGVKKFATKEAKFTQFQTLYSLAQCTPNINGTDCRSCLQIAIERLNSCCTDKYKAALSLLPSCTVQYHVTPFYPSSRTSEPPPSASAKKSNPSRVIIIITVSVVAVVVFIISSCIFFFLKLRKSKLKVETNQEIRGGECIQYDFSVIRAATDDFSDANKLGKGGFGAVYKGKLAGGELIAVKRLATDSGQGNIEFKNEVRLVANLQHRNLVRLQGFCLEKNEKLLIYEFVPNASLDYFLFDPVKSLYLDWQRRYKIIRGIARGLLYLHEDSRLRIIHRDLKASNVLLDAEMNPKISDFGIARLCPLDQTQNATGRIVGTYGYMAPEYAMHGHFSAKSDVYSFGVLMLEILSGRKSNAFQDEEENFEHLLSYAWRNWKDGTALNLVDPLVRDGSSRTELMRCIHIGLLCVQENVAQRPNMASVVSMLTSSSFTLPRPSQPAFLLDSNTQTNVIWSECSSSAATESNQFRKDVPILQFQHTVVSDNDVTISEQYPR